jgi:hypothetical protein
MDSFFTYRDEIEGKVGIGKLPNDLQSILENISTEYYKIIPDKNASTYHTWFEEMPPNIKSKVEIIEKNKFWNKLCDGSQECIKISVIFYKLLISFLEWFFNRSFDLYRIVYQYF